MQNIDEKTKIVKDLEKTMEFWPASDNEKIDPVRRKQFSTPEQIKQYKHYFASVDQKIEEFDIKKIDSNKLLSHNIRINDKSLFGMISRESFDDCYIEIQGSTGGGLTYIYQVLLGRFSFIIRVLNLNRESDFGDVTAQNVNKIGDGGYGQVYFVKLGQQKRAVKTIKFDKYKSDMKIFVEDRAYYKEIQLAIRQYCIYKLCSMLDVGPTVIFEKTHDLTCFNDCIMFQMELCQPENRNYILSEQFIPDLKYSVKLLHKFNIIHADIKGGNVLYSPTKKKMVLSDFGTAGFVRESIQQKTWTGYKGTPHRQSIQMKQIFPDKLGFVNMYMNDVYSLKLLINDLKSTKKKMESFSYNESISNQFDLNHQEFLPQNQRSNFKEKINSMEADYSNESPSEFANFSQQSMMPHHQIVQESMGSRSRHQTGQSLQTNTTHTTVKTFDTFSQGKAKIAMKINLYESQIVFLINFPASHEQKMNLTQAISYACKHEEQERVKHIIGQELWAVYEQIQNKPQDIIHLTLKNLCRHYSIYSDQIIDHLKIYQEKIEREGWKCEYSALIKTISNRVKNSSSSIDELKILEQKKLFRQIDNRRKVYQLFKKQAYQKIKKKKLTDEEYMQVLNGFLQVYTFCESSDNEKMNFLDQISNLLEETQNDKFSKFSELVPEKLRKKEKLKRQEQIGTNIQSINQNLIIQHDVKKFQRSISMTLFEQFLNKMAGNTQNLRYIIVSLFYADLSGTSETYIDMFSIDERISMKMIERDRFLSQKDRYYISLGIASGYLAWAGRYITDQSYGQISLIQERGYNRALELLEFCVQLHEQVPREEYSIIESEKNNEHIYLVSVKNMTRIYDMVAQVYMCLTKTVNNIYNGPKLLALAQKNATKALKIREDFYKPHLRVLDIAISYKHLGTLYLLKEQVKVAEQYLLHSQAILVELSAETHYTELQNIRNNLAFIYERQKNFVLAKKTLKKNFSNNLIFRSRYNDQLVYYAENLLIMSMRQNQGITKQMESYIQITIRIKYFFLFLIEHPMCMLYQNPSQPKQNMFKLTLKDINKEGQACTLKTYIELKQKYVKYLERYCPQLAYCYRNYSSQIAKYYTEKKMYNKAFKYLWKYFQFTPIIDLQDADFYKLDFMVKTLMKQGSYRRALKELKKFIYKIPDSLEDLRNISYERMAQMHRQLQFKDAEFFTTIFEKKMYKDRDFQYLFALYQWKDGTKQQKKLTRKILEKRLKLI